MKVWSGRAVMQAREFMARYLPAPCGKCGQPVDGTTPWVVGHRLARATHPHLTWEPSNWQHEHRACSDRTGQAAVIEKARMEGAAMQAGLFDAEPHRVFPVPPPAGQSPLLSFSLPATGEPIDTRPDLEWSTEAMLEHPWTEEFATVPGDASPPLYMTPVPADAVGSYAVEPCYPGGLTGLEWIEKAERKRLRWWQRLAIVRQLEHRADGTLCHREVVESCPRRAGKSVRLRGVALWRLAVGPTLFGEVQTVIHTGSDLAICREIQRGAWRWAEEQGWSLVRANGKESVETPTDDRWLVRSQEGVYGYDVTLGLGDECWDVKVDTITEGIEPAMLERSSPQLHLTSTAHRRATSLMRGKIVAALTSADPQPGVLVLVWAARHGCDPSDPEVWRAASPHWSEDRHRMIAAKHDAAQAGQVDPSADDPDPMAGFVAQYLNVWPMKPADRGRGEPAVVEPQWRALAQPAPTTPPVAAAIESWFEAGATLAVVWQLDGRLLVAAYDTATVTEAAVLLASHGGSPRLVVGKGLLNDDALAGLRPEGRTGRAGAALATVTRLLGEDRLRHDGGAHLGGQVLAARTVPGVDGPRMVSHGRADALKAAAWALEAAELPRIGKPRVILPSFLAE